MLTKKIVTKAPKKIKQKNMPNKLPTLEEELPKIERVARWISVRDIAKDDRLSFGELNHSLVKEYTEQMKLGALFPSILVIEDHDDRKFKIIDGHHRYNAAVSAGETKMLCDVVQNLDDQPAPTVEREGRWLAAASNKGQLKKRTNKEKLNAAIAAIKSPIAESLSVEQLAVHTGLSHTYLYSVQKRLADGVVDSEEEENDEVEKTKIFKISAKIANKFLPYQNERIAFELIQSIVKATSKAHKDGYDTGLNLRSIIEAMSGILSGDVCEYLCNYSEDTALGEEIADYLRKSGV